MFEKILIATDLSPASDCLVQCAAELKALGLKQVILAHVVYVANMPGLEEMLMENAKPQLEHQKKLLEEQGTKVTIVQELGIPAADVSDLAERHDVAAILIGSRGHGLARSALGSVSFKLLQIATRPVFLSHRLLRHQRAGFYLSCKHMQGKQAGGEPPACTGRATYGPSFFARR